MKKRRRKDHTDEKFSRLTIIKDAEDRVYLSGNIIRTVLCKCDCGKTKIIILANILRGKSSSCGCFKEELRDKRCVTHGLTNHHIYRNLWRNMKSRCYNKNNKIYNYYGGRGITICNEWQNDFKAFYDWCIENGWKKGLQIDRIDNDGNYEPDNCRFTTARENCLNQRSVKKSNTSGYTGVYWHKVWKNWKSTITINNKRINLGSFTTPEEAVEARNDYIIQNNLQADYKIQTLTPSC